MRDLFVASNARYRLEFWVDEFNADPKETNFQIFRNERGDEFDELLSEAYFGLIESGLTENDVARMLATGEISTEYEPDGSGYSDRAHYYFDNMVDPPASLS